MKISFIVLMCAFLQVSATTFAQKVNIDAKNASVKKVLYQITRQTGFNFIADASLVKKIKPITLSLNGVEMADALTMCFNGVNIETVLNSDYKTIVIREVDLQRQPSAVLVDVKGKVTDEGGGPLPGVSVTLKGSQTGVVTDASGNYQIRVPEETAVLVFSFMGFMPQELKITLKNANNILNVVLKEKSSGLQEVVVTGYQTINKKLFTGSATTVNMKDIKTEGSTDVSRMLEGRVAGVSVQNVSGTFGSAPKLRVRGATSITGDNKPLWVVDGVVLEDVVNISNDQLSSGDALTLIGSSVAGINTEDIQSLEILKDASATAMYGARAMNGVVVITTKKGKIGKPVVNYSGNYSTYLKPTYGSFNIMNSVDQMSTYLDMERKGLLNFSKNLRAANGGVFTKMYQLIDQYDKTTGTYGLANTPEAREGFLRRYAAANTDWFDILFKNSFVQEHAISISSGTDVSQYYFSGSYFNDAGWTIADKVNRYTVNMRADHKFNEKFSASTIVTASLRDQLAPGTQGRSSNAVFGEISRDFDINPYSYALNTSRTLTAHDENGDLEYFTKSFAPFNVINELQENKININVMDLKAQGELGYKVIKNLEYKVLGSMRYVKNTREHMATEYSNMANAYRADGNGDGIITGANGYLYKDPNYPNQERQIILPEGGFYIRNEDYLKSFYGRHTLNYKTSFNEKHQLSAFLGQEMRYADRQNVYFNGYGYQYYKGGVPFTDYRIIKQAVENNYSYFGVNYSFDRFISMFSNINYAYDNKYVLNLTARYDGSNKMGKSNTARYLPTWTVSGAWNVDEEKFLKDVRWIDFLKVRGTYGLTASMGNATNTSVVYNNTITKRATLDDSETMIEISSLENSDLTWEKQNELNIGLDFSLFKNALTLSVDYYKRNSFDLINTLKVSGVGGQSTKIANYADMNSSGMEFNISSRVYTTTNFNYKTHLTFGYNKNSINNLKNTPRIWDLVKAEGGPLEGNAVRGLYSIVFSGLDPLTGIPMFIDAAGQVNRFVSVQSTNTSYLKYEGSVDPLITGGLSNSFTYKGLSLNVFVSYQLKNKIRLDPRFKSTYSDLDAMPNEFKDRWVMPGDERYTNIPSIIDYQTNVDLVSAFPYNYYNYADVRAIDGSFVRLKTISVNYSLPKTVAEKLRLKNIAFALNANNVALLYADKMLMGQDPEFFNSGGVAQPLPKQFTFTLKVGL